MAAPTVVASYTSVQGDGGNVGLAITTDGTPAAGDYLVVGQGVNANADTLTPPGGWTEATVGDNVVTTSGGQLRVWYLKNPAASTTYTWTVSTSTRRSIIGALVRGADGTTFIDVKGSLETAPGATHTAPSVTTTGTDRLVVDFAFHRQFAPDAAGWTPPASGLTWTKHADVEGVDSNNNIRLAVGSATAASAGAVSTAGWTATDVFEDSLILRIAVIPAVAGGGAGGWLPRQGRRRTGTPPRVLPGEVRTVQAPPLQQPVPVDVVQARRRPPVRARRAGVFSPPWPIVVQTPPVWVPQPRRSRPELPLIHRETKAWQPPWVGAAPATPPSWVPQPRRGRVLLPASRRDRLTSPPASTTQPVPAPRRSRLAPPIRIQHPFRIVLPTAVPAVPPPIVLQPPRRRPRFLGVRHGRWTAPLLEGAESVECIVHRPFTGTVTRAATGTVTRPYTGIVEHCSCCT